LQSKWDKAFWARGYYVEIIGNITDEAVTMPLWRGKHKPPLEVVVANLVILLHMHGKRGFNLARYFVPGLDALWTVQIFVTT